MQASRFHLLVADAAKNQILADVVRPFFRLMLERGPSLYETTEGYAQWELDQHQGSWMRSAPVIPKPRACGCWST